MKWKDNARRRPKTGLATRKRMEEAVVALAPNPIRIVNGKPLILVSHTRDFVEHDENGHSEVIASINFRHGDYIFPKAYLHPGKRIVGEPRDARMTARGWVIYLDAVLRDKNGEPVQIDGCEIDMSGWYLESDLRDAGLGMETLRLGALSPSIEDLEAGRVARIRKQIALSQTA